MKSYEIRRILSHLNIDIPHTKEQAIKKAEELLNRNLTEKEMELF